MFHTFLSIRISRIFFITLLKVLGRYDIYSYTKGLSLLIKKWTLVRIGMSIFILCIDFYFGDNYMQENENENNLQYYKTQTENIKSVFRQYIQTTLIRTLNIYRLLLTIEVQIINRYLWVITIYIILVHTFNVDVRDFKLAYYYVTTSNFPSDGKFSRIIFLGTRLHHHRSDVGCSIVIAFNVKSPTNISSSSY